MAFPEKKTPPALKPLSKRPQPDPGAMAHEAAETPQQEQREHMNQPKVEPHMVGYRDGDEICSKCSRFAQPNSHCELLEMTVDPAGSCSAWAQGDGAEEQGEQVEEATEQE